MESSTECGILGHNYMGMKQSTLALETHNPLLPPRALQGTWNFHSALDVEDSSAYHH